MSTTTMIISNPQLRGLPVSLPSQFILSETLKAVVSFVLQQGRNSNDEEDHNKS